MTSAAVVSAAPVSYGDPTMRPDEIAASFPAPSVHATPLRRGERSHVVIAEQLRRQIQLGMIPPGAALPPERELTRIYHAGRATIQQALNVLQGDGLIRRVRGRAGGTFVEDSIETEHHLDVAIQRVIADRTRIEEAIAFRALIEPGVAVEASRRRTSDDLALIREAQEHLCGSGLESDFMRHDDAFHAAIGWATHNRYLQGAAEVVRQALNDAIWVLPGSEVWLERTIHEHDAILAAVTSQDGAAAEAAARLHSGHTAESIRSLLAALPKSGP
jgi:GntR family transcriptional repressor for pyruvate dehydrogenase complex